eukprot:14594161-Alexandrium_andersonii.AAC.1
MSASLVGSEMCIRDREPRAGPAPERRRGLGRGQGHQLNAGDRREPDIHGERLHATAHAPRQRPAGAGDARVQGEACPARRLPHHRAQGQARVRPGGPGA